MTEPKNNTADLPEDDEPFDAPPAPAGDPLFEDDGAPDEPGLPDLEPEPPDEPELPDVEDAARPEPVAEPADEPEAVAEPEAESAAEPVPEPEPAPIEEPEPEPEPIQEPEPVPEAEPDTAEDFAAEAAREAVDDPHHDIFGPEPWDQAPPPTAAPAPEPAAEAAPPSAWADVGPARAGTRAAPAHEPAFAPVGVAAAASEGADASLEVKRSAYAVYIVYLASIMLAGAPLPLAAFWAYQQRGDAPGWLRSHYTYQIRTFWICVGMIALAGLVLFLPFALFPLTIVATVVWLVVRCFFGMVRLHRGEPIFNPQTWIV